MASAVETFLEKSLDLTKDQVSALNAVVSIVGAVEGIIGGVQGAVNFVTSILTMLGIISAPASALDIAVQTLIQEFKDLLFVEGQQITMLDIAQWTGQADSAFTLLQNALESNSPPDPSATTGDAAWIDMRNTIDSQSNLAAQTLGQSAYWTRPFYSELVYSDAWVGNLVPPSPSDPNTPASSGGLVFDYRLPLPACLKVVSVRLVILAAFNRSFGQGIRQELAGYVNLLIGYYTTMVSGLVEHNPPEYAAVLAHYETPQGAPPTLFPSAWALAGNLLGAVDVYSTLHLVDPWPAEVPGNRGLEPLPPTGTPPPPDQYPPFSYPKFLVRHLVLTLTRWKGAYNQIGLTQTAALIAQLNQLAGNPAPSLTGPTGDWSVKELGRRLSNISGSGFAMTGTPGSPLISARQVLAVLQTTNATPYSSLRAALAQ